MDKLLEEIWRVIEEIWRVIEEILSPSVASPKVVVCGVRQVLPRRMPNLHRSRHSSIHRQAVTVNRKPQPYWLERGWQRIADAYEGYYLVNGQSYKGRVKQSKNRLDFYVIDPPYQVRHHPCFRHRGNGTFWVHWHGSSPRTLSSGLMSVEHALLSVLM